MSSRTTVRLDDDLIRELKHRAKRDNISLTKLINQTIRSGLSSRPKKPKYRYVEKTYDMGEPLVDLSHTNAVLDELEIEDALRKMAQGK